MKVPSPHYKKYLKQPIDHSDKLVRERLQRLSDQPKSPLTEWEERFIEMLVLQYHGPLTVKQKHYANKLLARHHY